MRDLTTRPYPIAQSIDRLVLAFAIIAIVCLAVACPAHASVSPNLLSQSGFEPVGPGKVDLTAWSIVTFPENSDYGSDTTVKHSGNTSFRVTLPAAAPLDYYFLGQPLSGLKRGSAYTLSAYIKTRGMHDGVGAYISLNFFNGTQRIGYHDSPKQVTGDNGWVLISSTAIVPEGTTDVRALLVVNGHGTAWFDDVQLEEGDQVSPYSPASTDSDAVARYASEQTAAQTWLSALHPIATGQSRIALLQDVFSTGGSAPSHEAVLADALSGAGYKCVTITPDQASNSTFLDPANFDLLIVPTGDAYPAKAQQALVDYLRRGGLLLTTGGYAFDRPLVQFDGKWLRSEDLPAGNLPTTPVFNESASGWIQASNRTGSPLIESAPGPNGEPGVKISTDRLDLWDTAISPSIAGKLPVGWSITRFWAKGDAGTPSMLIEWHEKDGSRWKTKVSLSPSWREYVLFAKDFAYWQDSSSVGRGGGNDRFHPENASSMQVGVAVDVAAKDQPHAVWFAGVRVQADAAGALRGQSPHINTRYGMIRDAMWPGSTQIPVFDAGFPLDHVSSTRPSAGQDLITGFELHAPLTGYSAITMLDAGGHGFTPNLRRWTPLLSCYDAYGHPRGEAGAMIQNYAGAFAGSSWAIFGVTNQDLFKTGSPALHQVLLPTVAGLLRRFYLHDTESEFACYRDGDAVHLHTNVSNFGKAPRSALVRFMVRADGGVSADATPSQEITIAPGSTQLVDLVWQPAKFASDYYTVTAELVMGGKVIDHEDNAFVAWSPSILARGPKLGKEGTHFTIDGRPTLLFGCESFWGQTGNLTARSPAAFERDFAQMRSYGLRWSRAFLPFKTERDKRVCDAVIQLAQKNGIVLYDAINMSNTADTTTLQQETATMREAIERYKGVPGLAIDICNEPEFKAIDPALKRLVPDAVTTGAWTAHAPTAYWRAMADAQRRWATANDEAIHAVDASRMGSVGWSQGWAGGANMKDPLLASLDLDFTDRHYYGNLDGFIADFKDLDLRSLGKPLILGECGAVDHPTYKAMDPWGNGTDDAGFDHRFLYLTHHVAGLGGAVMSSWHWRDPIEGIFPFGVTHQTGVPRPTALLYRACALALSQFKPITVIPSVVLLSPDEGRMGGQRDRVIAAVHHAASLLVADHIDYTVLPDSELARLPAATRAVIYPIPLDPSDDVIERLAAFASKGGVVYVSGDISYDSNRTASARGRLKRLCGLEWKADRCTPGADAWPLNVNALSPLPLVPAAGSNLTAGDSRPAIEVGLAGAKALATANGLPVVTRFAVGQGAVWFSADPIEIAIKSLPAHRALYRAIVADAGVEPLKVEPDSPLVDAFHVPGSDADAWIFYNGGPEADITAGGFTLHLKEQGAGLVIVGHDGSVRAVEAQGEVRRGATAIARFASNGFLVAQDDMDIAQSKDLLALPLAPGAISLTRSAPETPASVVDWSAGSWRRLGPVNTTVTGKRLTIDVGVEQSREVIRVH
ncbi:MAG: hypothetical protein P4L33_04120 [Capsulimonadaceae bacterium]|nr:hypothetical protein [Capsulimonadaceae bacterium]